MWLLASCRHRSVIVDARVIECDLPASQVCPFAGSTLQREIGGEKIEEERRKSGTSFLDVLIDLPRRICYYLFVYSSSVIRSFVSLFLIYHFLRYILTRILQCLLFRHTAK